MFGIRYIYNPIQANFMIKSGVTCIGTGINKNTNKIYWEFDYKLSKNAYELWCNNKND